MRTFARRSSMFALAGVLALGAVACGDDAEDAEVNVTEEDTTAPAGDTTIQEGDTELDMGTETQTEMTTETETQTDLGTETATE